MLLSIYSSDIAKRVWMASSRFLKSNFCMFSRGAWWVYCIRYVTSSYVNSNKFSIFIRNKLGQMWGSMIFFPEKQCVWSFKLFSVAFDWPAFQCARFFHLTSSRAQIKIITDYVMSIYCLEATKYKFHWTNKKSLNRKHNPKKGWNRWIWRWWAPISIER